MTDKENRTLKNGVIAIFDKFNILDHTATIGGLRDDILRYIDSLQEEPVSEELEEEVDTYIKDNFTIDKEQLDRFCIEEKDYMYSMDKSDILTMVKYFTNLQKEKDIKIITDVEAVAFANGMAQMKKQIEESVSENLEEAALEYANNQLIKSGVTDTNCPRELAVAQASLMVNGFKAGAKWQKEQDKETIELAEDHAMLAGMEKMKQEMMAKAINGDITFDYYGDDDKTYGCIAHDSFCLEDFGLKDRDKVKVIVIKEN